MQTYRFILRPLSAFGTPLVGDTLLGQLCWTLRYQLGNARLNELLKGYTGGQPFAVLSDALPIGFLPLPNVPSASWQSPATSEGLDRKALKKRKWLPVDGLATPFVQWQSIAKSDVEVVRADGVAAMERAQPHNTINRRTGTTGQGQFAPYVMPQIWFDSAMQFDLYAVLDEDRLTLAELTAALQYIGNVGFGRDASIGLGKFVLQAAATPVTWHAPASANAYLTLGPCAPQGLGLCPVRSTYQVVTRFGRHGDAAVQTGQPFKRPVLLAKAGAVFWPEMMDSECQFIGQGLGGRDKPISLAMPETVQQGYAPVVAISLPVEQTA